MDKVVRIFSFFFFMVLCYSVAVVKQTNTNGMLENKKSKNAVVTLETYRDAVRTVGHVHTAELYVDVVSAGFWRGVEDVEGAVLVLHHVGVEQIAVRLHDRTRDLSWSGSVRVDGDDCLLTNHDGRT